MKLRTILPTHSGAIAVGDGLPAYLIAEIGLNHNGSEELAKEMIHAAAIAGATFVKFQKRFPESLADSTFLDAEFEKAPAFGMTQRQVRHALELDLGSYQRLKKYAESLGLIFFATAFDLQSLDFLLEAGVSIIKIASHSVTNGPLLKKIADQKLPVICSLGASTLKEKDYAFDLLQHNPLVLLHCVSAYPTPDHMAFLDTIAYYKERYQRPVGFSSHEVGIDISMASVAMGACMIERHFTIDRSMIGLDQGISLEPSEFGELARKVRRMIAVRGVINEPNSDELMTKNKYHVSVHTAKTLTAGTVITADMICCKQPLGDAAHYFTGTQVDEVIGKKLTSDLEADVAIPRELLK